MEWPLFESEFLVEGPELLRTERKELLRTLPGVCLLRKLPEFTFTLVPAELSLRRELLKEPLLRAPPNVLLRVVDVGCLFVVVLFGLELLLPMRKEPFVEGRLPEMVVLLLLNEPPRRLLPNLLLGLLETLFTVMRVELLPPALLPLNSPRFHLSRMPSLGAGLRKWSLWLW